LRPSDAQVASADHGHNSSRESVRGFMVCESDRCHEYENPLLWLLAWHGVKHGAVRFRSHTSRCYFENFAND
jgi:hypothetical protein